MWDVVSFIAEGQLLAIPLCYLESINIYMKNNLALTLCACVAAIGYNFHCSLDKGQPNLYMAYTALIWTVIPLALCAYTYDYLYTLTGFWAISTFSLLIVATPMFLVFVVPPGDHKEYTRLRRKLEYVKRGGRIPPAAPAAPAPIPVQNSKKKNRAAQAAPPPPAPSAAPKQDNDLSPASMKELRRFSLAEKARKVILIVGIIMLLLNASEPFFGPQWGALGCQMCSTHYIENGYTRAASIVDSYGNTALHMSIIQEGRLPKASAWFALTEPKHLFSQMLKRGADMSIKNIHGISSRSLLARTRSPAILDLIDIYEKERRPSSTVWKEMMNEAEEVDNQLVIDYLSMKIQSSKSKSSS